MSERKSEATAYFDGDVSVALDILAGASNVTRSQWVSRVVIDAVAKEVDKANLLAEKLAGKRIARNLDE
jgi:hypothetical protein